MIRLFLSKLFVPSLYPVPIKCHRSYIRLLEEPSCHWTYLCLLSFPYSKAMKVILWATTKVCSWHRKIGYNLMGQEDSPEPSLGAPVNGPISFCPKKCFKFSLSHAYSPYSVTGLFLLRLHEKPLLFSVSPSAIVISEETPEYQGS